MKYIKEKEEKSVGSYLQFRQEENLKKEKEKKRRNLDWTKMMSWWLVVVTW